jgi:hypothetical protein
MNLLSRSSSFRRDGDSAYLTYMLEKQRAHAKGIQGANSYQDIG